MFSRARLRIALLYAALMGLTLGLVTIAIALLAVRQAQRSDDLELRIRAEGIATFGARVGVPPASVEVTEPPISGGPPVIVPLPGDPVVSGDEPRTGRLGPPSGGGRPDGPRLPQGAGIRPPAPSLEQQGMLAYVLPIREGAPVHDGMTRVEGLPDLRSATAALAANAGRYTTVTIPFGSVRLYNLPIRQDDQTIAIVQVARSRYYVESAAQRLVVSTLLVGGLGLAATTALGFGLAGLTLRPIARAIERQRSFTSDASHELRTPLSLIRGNAELLSRHPDRTIGDYDDIVTDIIDETDRLGRLVGNLLTLARSDEGGLQLSLAPVDLTALSAAVARRFEPAAAAKGLRLRAEGPAAVTLSGDADRLQELLVILLDNAVRYTSSGAIVVRVAGHAHAVTLAVTDSGPGVAPAHRERLFDRFYRTDAARTSEQGGAGLGLAIADEIARAHGGRISVASDLGHGSTFTVHLPRHGGRT